MPGYALFGIVVFKLIGIQNEKATKACLVKDPHTHVRTSFDSELHQNSAAWCRFVVQGFQFAALCLGFKV